jgi:hypothetical protein
MTVDVPNGPNPREKPGGVVKGGKDVRPGRVLVNIVDTILGSDNSVARLSMAPFFGVLMCVSAHVWNRCSEPTILGWVDSCVFCMLHSGVRRRRGH